MIPWVKWTVPLRSPMKLHSAGQQWDWKSQGPSLICLAVSASCYMGALVLHMASHPPATDSSLLTWSQHCSKRAKSGN